MTENRKEAMDFISSVEKIEFLLLLVLTLKKDAQGLLKKIEEGIQLILDLNEL